MGEYHAVGISFGFFGFVHSGEFTCPFWRDFTVDMLSPQDVSVDSHILPSYITIVIRRSKNDLFVVGGKLHLGRMGLPLCPVLALLCYLAIRPSRHGPHFLFDYIVKAKAGYVFAQGAIRRASGPVRLQWVLFLDWCCYDCGQHGGQ